MTKKKAPATAAKAAKPAPKPNGKPVPKAAAAPKPEPTKTPAPGPTPATPATRRKAVKEASALVQPPIPGIEPVAPADETQTTWEKMKSALHPRVVLTWNGNGVADVVLWLDKREYGPVPFSIEPLSTPAQPAPAEVVTNPPPATVEAPLQSVAPPPDGFEPKPGAPAGELDRTPPVELQVNIRYAAAAELDACVADLKSALGSDPAAVDPADEENDFATAFFDCETRVEADILAAGVRQLPFVSGVLAVDPLEARLSDDELAELDARARQLFVSPEPRVYCSRCVAIGRAPAAGLTPAAAVTGVPCYNCGWPEPAA